MLVFLRKSEVNGAHAGHFSPIRQVRQTNMKKGAAELQKKGKFETLKGSRGLKTYSQACEIIFSNMLNSKRKIISSSLRKTSLPRN